MGPNGTSSYQIGPIRTKENGTGRSQSKTPRHRDPTGRRADGLTGRRREGAMARWPRDLPLAFHAKVRYFSIYACHPCAGAMLIFSVSFQFLRMTTEVVPEHSLAHTLYMDDLDRTSKTTRSSPSQAPRHLVICDTKDTGDEEGCRGVSAEAKDGRWRGKACEAKRKRQL